MNNQNGRNSSSFLKNSMRLYLLSYVAAPLGYITRMIISRDISVEEVGILYTVLGFIGLLASYNGLGLIEALKYYIPKLLAEKKKNLISTALLTSLGMQVIMGIMIMIGLIRGSDRLAIHYFKAPEIGPFLQLACLYFVGNTLLQILSSIFLGFQDGFSSKFMDFLSILSILIFTIITYSFDAGSVLYYGMGRFIGILISVAIGLIIYIKKYHHLLWSEKPVWDTNFLKTFAQYSFWTFLSMNSGILLASIDQQMIMGLDGQTSAGFYANYISMLNIFGVGILPLISILLPTFTAFISAKDFEKLNAFTRKIYSYMSVFCISLSIIIFALAPEITKTLYGIDYLPSGDLLRFSVPFYILNVLAMINFTLLAGLGKVREKTLLTIGVGLLNALLNYFLISNFGNYGALSATILGRALMAGISFALLGQHKPKINWAFVLKNTALCLFLAAGIWKGYGILSLLTQENLILSFGLLGFAIFVYYLIIALYNRSEIQNALKLLVPLKQHK